MFAVLLLAACGDARPETATVEVSIFVEEQVSLGRTNGAMLTTTVSDRCPELALGDLLWNGVPPESGGGGWVPADRCRLGIFDVGGLGGCQPEDGFCEAPTGAWYSGIRSDEQVEVALQLDPPMLMEFHLLQAGLSLIWPEDGRLSPGEDAIFELSVEPDEVRVERRVRYPNPTVEYSPWCFLDEGHLEGSLLTVLVNPDLTPGEACEMPDVYATYELDIERCDYRSCDGTVVFRFDLPKLYAAAR